MEQRGAVDSVYLFDIDDDYHDNDNDNDNDNDDDDDDDADDDDEWWLYRWWDKIRLDMRLEHEIGCLTIISNKSNNIKNK